MQRGKRRAQRYNLRFPRKSTFARRTAQCGEAAIHSDPICQIRPDP
ncbi:hypothetical protein PATSB16_33190 [Pandoraea thiooxydans]|nr:hypothetical protein PATSB16_33190 [Pandoraea thiooxydans]